MEKRTLANRWVDTQWEAVGLLPDLEGDVAPRRLYDDGRRTQWLHCGFSIELFTDEAEFYYANITAPEPRVFVLWREEDGFARPVLLTVSYGLAARMLDAGEQVDGIAMPAELQRYVAEFVALHYKPEARKKGGRFATTRLNP